VYQAIFNYNTTANCLIFQKPAVSAKHSAQFATELTKLEKLQYSQTSIGVNCNFLNPGTHGSKKNKKGGRLHKMHLIGHDHLRKITEIFLSG